MTSLKQQTFAIVGGGLAGAKAAETLRAEGFDGRVIILGEETSRPYDRPPMSKEFLRGEKDFDDAAVHLDSFYKDQEIELRTSAWVSDLDTKAKQLTFNHGEKLAYDRLLLATGAVPREIKVPGSELDGIYYLRSVNDSQRLHDAIQHASRVIVIGAGWIGSEVAASARQLGAEVSLVEMAAVPLGRVLGAKAGGIFRDLHVDHGVDLHLRTGVEAFRGGTGMEEVLLNDGTTLRGDVVVVGVGVAPRVELAQSAGLDVDNGIVVDEHLATSDPDVFAAGDVASAFHPRYKSHIRLEHWAAALEQGPTAAENMLGKKMSYELTPFFFSDQYDLGMEYRGWAPRWDEVVFRGDVANREFIAFWLDKGRVAAGMNVNVWEDGDEIERLVASRTTVDPARLVNTGVRLADL